MHGIKEGILTDFELTQVTVLYTKVHNPIGPNTMLLFRTMSTRGLKLAHPVYQHTKEPERMFDWKFQCKANPKSVVTSFKSN